MVKEHYTVVNVMQNGEELDDLTGYIVPEDNPIYDFFIKINEEAREKTAWNYLIGFSQKKQETIQPEPSFEPHEVRAKRYDDFITYMDRHRNEWG